MSSDSVFWLVFLGLSTAGWVATTWIKARHGYPLMDDAGQTVVKGDPDAERTISLLSSENDRLTGQISRLEERVAVLERIATDPAMQTARAIDSLR